MESTTENSQAIPKLIDSPAIERIGQAMLKVLFNEQKGLPESTLSKRVAGRRQYKAQALRMLISNKRTLRIGSGTKGDPYRYSVRAEFIKNEVDEVIL